MRLSRAFFGPVLSLVFNPFEHDEVFAYTCAFTGRKMASNQMSWLLKKSERLPESDPKVIKLEVHHHFATTQGARMSAKLMSCSADVAPIHATHHGTLCDLLFLCLLHLQSLLLVLLYFFNYFFLLFSLVPSATSAGSISNHTAF